MCPHFAAVPLYDSTEWRVRPLSHHNNVIILLSGSAATSLQILNCDGRNNTVNASRLSEILIAKYLYRHGKYSCKFKECSSTGFIRPKQRSTRPLSVQRIKVYCHWVHFYPPGEFLRPACQSADRDWCIFALPNGLFYRVIVSEGWFLIAKSTIL